ncbi:MAG: transposase [Candidatus Omnitrophota bacterium]
MPKLLTRKSKIRLQGYDYTQSNHYFITACTDNKQEWFGEIKNNEMILNNYGNIIKQQWQWLGQQYPYVKLDEYIIMPNHVHGIIIINNLYINHFVTARSRPGPTHSNNIKIKSLSSLIGAFKTTSSKSIRLNGLSDFIWQRSFHDHIIRNEKSLQKIREYIINNPASWAEDEENINCITTQSSGFFPPRFSSGLQKPLISGVIPKK